MLVIFGSLWTFLDHSGHFLDHYGEFLMIKIVLNDPGVLYMEILSSVKRMAPHARVCIAADLQQ